MEKKLMEARHERDHHAQKGETGEVVRYKTFDQLASVPPLQGD
jgi:hypothetical protein